MSSKSKKDRILAKREAHRPTPAAVATPQRVSRLRQAKEETRRAAQKSFELVTVSYLRPEIDWFDEVTALLKDDSFLKRQRLATRSFVAQEALRSLAESLAGRSTEELLEWFKQRAPSRGKPLPAPGSKS